MGRRMRKKDIDDQLLNCLFTLENEWKKMESILEKSIDPTDVNLYVLNLAKAKYLFLLKEARYRKISAIRYR